jgi:hypothetical protein
MKGTRAILGISLIAIGLVFLLKAIGWLSFSIWPVFRDYWPVLIILIGISMVFDKTRYMIAATIIILIIAAVTFPYSTLKHDARTVYQYVDLDDDIEHVELDLDYGAGELSISGSKGYLFSNKVRTSDPNDPDIEESSNGTVMTIDIGRNTEDFRMGQWESNKWDVKLSPDVTYDLSLDYGAVDAKIDLTRLKVDTLDLNTGVSSTEIEFGNYPTKVQIDTGMADVLLRFPKDMPVKITHDGGLSSTNFEGFTDDGEAFYHGVGEGIVVVISSGMANIEAELY